MKMKFSLAILSLLILAAATFGAVRVLDIVTSERDGWDIFSRVDATTDMLTVAPQSLISEDVRESIEHVVYETRGFGIPWSIWVVGRDELNSSLAADQLAEQQFAEEPVESAEGAGDGLLMAVVVNEADLAETEVTFVTGPNFYPKGGITPERLDYIADVQMQILIDEERIGDAVVEGATWVEWMQLFEPTPSPPETNLERGLQDLLNPLGALAIAGIAALVAGAALVIRVLTWRGAPSTAREPLNGLTTAAISRGRVDDAVTSGVILDAIDRGVLNLDDGGLVSIANGETRSRWDDMLLTAIHGIERRGSSVTLPLLLREVKRTGNLRRAIEDRLAREGLYHPKSPVYTILLRWIAATGAVLGLVAVIIAVMGESGLALGASIALTAVSLVILIWNERRTWRSRAGSKALREWLDQHDEDNDRERVLYEAIMVYETVDLMPPQQSPIRPDAAPLIATLDR